MPRVSQRDLHVILPSRHSIASEASLRQWWHSKNTTSWKHVPFNRFPLNRRPLAYPLRLRLIIITLVPIQIDGEMMDILSVSVGQPTHDNAAWWRISNIDRLLRSKGHNVDFVRYCSSSSDRRFEREWDRSPGHRLVTASKVDAFRKHIRNLAGRHYDLVYANTTPAGFLASLGRKTGQPLATDMHGDEVSEVRIFKRGRIPKPSYLQRVVKAEIQTFSSLLFSDIVLCASHRMKEAFTRKGVRPSKLAHIPNGVDLSFFQPTDDNRTNELRDKFDLHGKMVFGYVGSTAIWQGVESFVRMAQHVRDERLAFLVVGAGQNIIQDSAKSNVIFEPWVPRADLMAYYSVSDVLVLPRPKHAVTDLAAPTKLSEYAAMGKPILTTDVGDPADFVRKYNCGIVVESNLHTHLAGGVREFARKSDAELTAMGRNSRRLAEMEFDWHRIGDRLEIALESVLGR